MGRRLAVSGALAVAAAGLLWLRQPREAIPDLPPARPVPRPAAVPPAATVAPTALPPLPASLRDTEVDGALAVDARGHFAPGPEALALFDYFLSATGEEPDDVIRARIVALARARLPADAAREAEALLDTYLRYRDHMRALTTRSAPPSDLERRLQWIREERRRIFGPDLAETLFGEEEQVTRIDLERRRVLQDAAVAPEERARRLEALEARLPERVREARHGARAPVQVEQEVAALRAAGASEASVFAARERAFGAEAAARLEALDRERADFEARLAAHAADRDRLRADASLSPEEREARLAALREARFTERERLRVRSLDEIREVSR